MVCELATHSLIIVSFLHVDVMFIVYNVSGTIGLTFPGRRHYFFDIPMQRHLLLLYVAILGPC